MVQRRLYLAYGADEVISSLWCTGGMAYSTEEVISSL